MKPKESANTITRYVMAYLSLRGHEPMRNNTTGVYDPYRKRFRTGPRSARGSGDVLCCIRGNWLEIEVKAGPDVQSEFQLEREKRIKAAGGMYFVVRSRDEFDELAREHGW